MNEENNDTKEYWKQRCLLAEKCLAESPDDPDITPEQIKAHAEWEEFIAKYLIHVPGTIK